MRRIVFLLIATLLMIGLALPGCAPSTLTILSMTEGNVSVMKAGTDDWIEGEVGMSLEEGDIIKTGDDSSAEITFLDGSTMELEAGTKIEAVSLDITRDTGSVTIILEQTIGSIIFRVIKIIDPASRHEVETPAGVVAVRGSVVQVHVTEDGTTWASNLEGEIWAIAQDVELQVPEGQQCIITPGQPPRLTGNFVQMTLGDPDSLDPAWGYDALSGEQVAYVYETLLFYDGEEIDQFVPVLATEWELLDDNVTNRFKIREGVKFHEGGDLTPQDVEYSFERAMVQDRFLGPVSLLYQPLLDLYSSRDGNGTIQVTFDQIDNAVEVDGDWVVFNLSNPSWGMPFLQILCGAWASIVDREWCIANGEWDGTEETWEDYNNPDKANSYLYDHTNGTGPWKLEEWDPGVEIKLVRNDNYWREPAAFERVITQVVAEWTTRKEALLAGDADLIYVPPAYVDELEGIEDLVVYRELPATPLNIEVFFFNMAIAEDSTYIGSGALDGNGIPTDFFTDLDVRRGFCYAFDWETYINDAYVGEADQRGSPIVEGLLFYNPDASMYSLELDKAEEHLQAAWDGELWVEGFKCTLLYRSDIPRYETACEILTENLVNINPKFQVSVQSVTRDTYSGKIWGTGDMPMFQIGWAADYPDPNNFAVPFMASYGVFAQRQGYSNSYVDDLIVQGTSTMDSSERQAIYYELQQIYYDDAPGIVLVQPLGRRYFTSYIQGFYFNPFIPGQAGPLYYMSKWEP